jgi:hypothetical protein
VHRDSNYDFFFDLEPDKVYFFIENYPLFKFEKNSMELGTTFTLKRQGEQTITY